MNRQLRRANEKSDKKKDREKQRRRKERVAVRQSARTSPKPAPKKQESKGGTRTTGRWAGRPLAIATIVIVLMGAVLPQEQTKVAFVIDLAYYLLFGYFAGLWLLRRKTQRALFLATLGGFLLSAIVELANLYRPGYEWQPLIILLSIPVAFLGALLGRTLYRYGQT